MDRMMGPTCLAEPNRCSFHWSAMCKKDTIPGSTIWRPGMVLARRGASVTLTDVPWLPPDSMAQTEGGPEAWHLGASWGLFGSFGCLGCCGKCQEDVSRVERPSGIWMLLNPKQAISGASDLRLQLLEYNVAANFCEDDVRRPQASWQLRLHRDLSTKRPPTFGSPNR